MDRLVACQTRKQGSFGRHLPTLLFLQRLRRISIINATVPDGPGQQVANVMVRDHQALHAHHPGPLIFSNSIYQPHLLHTSHLSRCPHAGPASQTRACLIHLDHLNHLDPFRSAVRFRCRACLPVHQWWSCSTARSSADGCWSGRRGGRGGRNAHGGNNLHRGECTLASVVTVKQAIGVGNPADGALPNRGILQPDV